MAGAAQLGWVQRNRRRADRAERVGTVVGRIAGGLVDRDIPLLQELADDLEKVMDREFWRHCTISAVSGGTLVIAVSHPSSGCFVRAKWLPMVEQVVRRGRHRGRIRKVIMEIEDPVGIGACRSRDYQLVPHE
ncbi:MAG: DUF721 domain-containing protein [Planctomycetes bacterium]|nr:DUF721 domain-containing protein [Planctomycetota bacterium]